MNPSPSTCIVQILFEMRTIIGTALAARDVKNKLTCDYLERLAICASVVFWCCRDDWLDIADTPDYNCSQCQWVDARVEWARRYIVSELRKGLIWIDKETSGVNCAHGKRHLLNRARADYKELIEHVGTCFVNKDFEYCQASFFFNTELKNQTKGRPKHLNFGCHPSYTSAQRGLDMWMNRSLQHCTIGKSVMWIGHTNRDFGNRCLTSGFSEYELTKISIILTRIFSNRLSAEFSSKTPDYDSDLTNIHPMEFKLYLHQTHADYGWKPGNTTDFEEIVTGHISLEELLREETANRTFFGAEFETLAKLCENFVEFIDSIQKKYASKTCRFGFHPEGEMEFLMAKQSTRFSSAMNQIMQREINSPHNNRQLWTEKNYIGVFWLCEVADLWDWYITNTNRQSEVNLFRMDEGGDDAKRLDLKLPSNMIFDYNVLKKLRKNMETKQDMIAYDPYFKPN